MSERITHEQALADHEYLWSTYAAAYDMTGGYVDQEDLSRMLQKPTKATAVRCLTSQINYWFQVGPDVAEGHSGCQRARDEAIENDEMVREIGERYGCI